VIPGLTHNKNSHLLSSFGYQGSGYYTDNKKPPEGGLLPSFFTGSTVTYRFPFGLALAPLRKSQRLSCGFTGQFLNRNSR